MTPQPVSSRIAFAVATWAYTGYSPVAPGTAGSAAGLLLIVPLRMLGSPWLDVGAALVVFAVGIWSATVVERQLGIEDPGIVVVDEVLGMLVSLLWLPLSWPVVVAAFLLFRVFDIIKPWPAGRFEHLGGGLGIMADDAMAGVYANLVVQVLVWWRPGWMV
ncbi:MAG: phosphatidylglycerophosphatase A [Acidobacteriota bacterium]